MNDNQRRVAEILNYLQHNHCGEATKGIPINGLTEWAKGNDGLSTDLYNPRRSLPTQKRGLARDLEGLMQMYPGVVGFYVPKSENPTFFHTLEPREVYADHNFKGIGKLAKYYLIKGDLAISSLNMAFSHLIQKTMGEDDFSFLENTLKYSLNYSVEALEQVEGQFHNNWLSKIEMTPRYQSLYPPRLNDSSEEICRAIFVECSFTASYLDG